ncbi:MAG: chemotaxis protein CheR [Nitrosospira sp.]|nr:chemotaxis protein CheR [Nitrosospira sp.]
MRTALPHSLLAQLSKVLELEMGLYYPAKCWGDLERRMAAAALALGTIDTETCIRQLLSASLTQKQIEIMASYLTVGETYFFREKRCIDVLEERIFPELIRASAWANRPLRIWSAGCCTGEEPYSIAILLDQLIQRTGEWNATILATDINPKFLEKAAEGLYSEWSFRDTPAWVKERYFKRRKNGQFEILPHIRKRVTFSYLNLAEDVYPSIINGTDAMDIIFCRNVLMYFSPEGVKKIGQNFHRTLVDGGWLILSPVEISNNLFPQFKTTAFPGAILYHKNESPGRDENIPDPSALLPDRLPGTTFLSAPGLTLPYLPYEEMPALLKDTGKETFPWEAPDVPAATTGKDLSHPEKHEQFDEFCDKARSVANLGELTEAAILCEKAIAANKLNPTAHYLLATVRQELGESITAIESLIRTLYLDPDFVLAHFALGNLCMTQGRQREAERHLDNALALLHCRPDDEPLPESNGLTAGRLRHIITSARERISFALGKEKLSG